MFFTCSQLNSQWHHMVQWSNAEQTEYEGLDCLQSPSLNSLFCRFCHVFVSWIHVIQARHQCLLHLPSLNSLKRRIRKEYRIRGGLRLTHCNQANNRSIHSSSFNIIHRYMSVRTRVSKLGIRAGWKKTSKAHKINDNPQTTYSL